MVQKIKGGWLEGLEAILCWTLFSANLQLQIVHLDDEGTSFFGVLIISRGCKNLINQMSCL